MAVQQDRLSERSPGRVPGSAPSPFLFVVGCPRSGTTLLQRMLNCHPDLAVTNDTHFIPRVVKRWPLGSDPVLTPDLIEAVCRYHRFPRLGIENEVYFDIASRSRRYSELVGKLYQRVAEDHGKSLAGEKTPDYCRHIPRLHSLFPHAKFVHIIRDGRDVALSLLDWAHESKGPGRLGLWKEEPVGLSALWWRWQVESGYLDGGSLPSDLYLEVPYEGLVSEPRETLRRIVHFLGLPFAAEMEEYHKGRTRRDPELSAKKAWLPPTKGLRNWRDQMAPSDVALFEAITGDLLVRLGYDPRFDTYSEETLQTASKCERWWSRQRRFRRPQN